MPSLTYAPPACCLQPRTRSAAQFQPAQLVHRPPQNIVQPACHRCGGGKRAPRPSGSTAALRGAQWAPFLDWQWTSCPAARAQPCRSHPALGLHPALRVPDACAAAVCSGVQTVSKGRQIGAAIVKIGWLANHMGAGLKALLAARCGPELRRWEA